MGCVPDSKRHPCAVANCGGLVHVPDVDMEAAADAGVLFLCGNCSARTMTGLNWEAAHGRD